MQITMLRIVANFIWLLSILLAIRPYPAQAQTRKPTPPRTDPFQVKSVWVNETITLSVVERKGEKFRAKLSVGDSVERDISGTVKDGKVTWLAKDVKTIKGDQGGDNYGTIQGDRIDFEARHSNGKTTAFTLRRSTGRTTKPEGPAFLIKLQAAERPTEQIRQVRKALDRLDRAIKADPSSPFEVTVKVLQKQKTFSSPKAARKGVETMLLAAADEVCRQYGVTIITSEVSVFREGSYWQTKAPKHDDVLVFGLDLIRFLSGFSVQAIRRSGLKHVVLCEDATLNGRAAPGAGTGGANASQDTILFNVKGAAEGERQRPVPRVVSCV